MTEIQVEPIRTPVTMIQYASACREAWISELGSDAPHMSVAVLWGQYMVETGGASCWCWNIGNVKRIKGDGNPWMVLRGNKEAGVAVGPSASMFRAFDSLAQAMALHLRFLYKADGRYTKAWNCVIAGAPEDCARELYDAGYYTGLGKVRETNIAAYAVGMRRNFNIFRSKIEAWDRVGEDRIVTSTAMRTIAETKGAYDAVREDGIEEIVEGVKRWREE